MKDQRAGKRRKAEAVVPAKPSQTRLRAQIGSLQRRLTALNVEADGSARRLLGDAARFLGAALARLQEADEVIGQNLPRRRQRQPAAAPGADPLPRHGAVDDDESETLFANAFHCAMGGMAIVDPDGRALKVNAALRELLGYSEKELCRGSVFDITHPDDVAASRTLIERLLGGTQASGRAEKRYLRKDGSILWGLLSLTLVRAADGRPRYFVAQIEDIGDRRAALAALHDSEHRFQSAFDDAPVGMVLARPDGVALRVNRALCEMVGYSAAELLAMRPNQISHPDDAPLVAERLAASLAGGDSRGTMDLRYLHKNGQVVWGRVAASLVRDANGEPSHMIVQIENITGRKQIECSLQENESKFRTLAETSAALIFIIQGSRFLYANAAAETLTGYRCSELDGNWFKVIAPEYRELARTRAEARQRGALLQERDEVKIVSKDGTPHWVEFSAAPITYEGAPAILGTAFDITERRRVSEALRKSDERFALAVAGAHDGIWDWRFDRDDLYVSPRLAAIFGYGADELDLTPAALLESVHPDDRTRVEQDVRAHAAGATPHLISEYRIRHRDGSYRWVLTRGLAVRGPDGQALRMAGSLTDITERKRSEEALRASEAKNKAILEASPDTFIRIRRDGTILDVKGDTSSWRTPAAQTMGRTLGDLMPPEMAAPALESIARAVSSGEMQTYEFETETGQGAVCLEARIVACGPDEALCSLRDMTARRRAEQEARQRLTELAHVSRVSNMGEMAAALAHELNQPLMAIVGYASGCALRVEAGTIEPPELQSALRHVSHQAVRAGEILRRLRDFVRKGPPHRSRVDINSLAREVRGLADVEARQHTVAVRLELDETLPEVSVDPIQIEQVMLNLIRNGIEAMSETPAPRTLTLRTSRAAANAVAVTVIDCGKGLPTGITDLFEPFVTTKPKGLGLGLSISRSIVEAHGGRLSAWSEEGPTTVFELTLPVARGGMR